MVNARSMSPSITQESMQSSRARCKAKTARSTRRSTLKFWLLEEGWDVVYGYQGFGGEREGKRPVRGFEDTGEGVRTNLMPWGRVGMKWGCVGMRDFEISS